MLRRVAVFLCLPLREQWLYIRSLLLLAVVRIGLTVLPLRTVRRLLNYATPSAPVRQGSTSVSADRIIHAVTVASRYVPRATCLPQALTAQVLLARHGYPAELRIGFAREEDGGIRGHAWLEDRGQVLIGDADDLHQFTLLPSLE